MPPLAVISPEVVKPTKLGLSVVATPWSRALMLAMLVNSLSIKAPAAVTLVTSVTSARASMPFSFVWSASVKTLESVAASTSVLISAAVWSAVAPTSIPSSLVPSTATSRPSIVLSVVKAPVIAGVVRVLLVNVCASSNVATVASMASVTPLPSAVEVTPVPPSKLKASLSKSMEILVVPSVTSKSCAVTCEST